MWTVMSGEEQIRAVTQVFVLAGCDGCISAASTPNRQYVGELTHQSPCWRPQ
jgi:hypothetical protein